MAKVEITIQLKPTLMDAQGATINKALHNLGYDNVKGVRIGKFIELEVEGEDAEQVEAQVREMCEKLLTNPIIEDYDSVVSPAQRPSEPMLREPRAAYTAGRELEDSEAPEDWRGFYMTPQEYEELDVEEKGHLYSEFQQLHGGWIETQLQARDAVWILIAEGEVVNSGPRWHDGPDDYEVAEMSLRDNRMYWVFETFPLIEETSWVSLQDRDAYPALRLEVVNDSTSKSWAIIADFDSGSNTTVLDESQLRDAEMLPSKPRSIKEAVHLGSTFQYSRLPLSIRLADETNNRHTERLDCAVVYSWDNSPWTRINPGRQALAGRDLLLSLSASVELNGKDRKTYIRRVG